MCFISFYLHLSLFFKFINTGDHIAITNSFSVSAVKSHCLSLSLTNAVLGTVVIFLILDGFLLFEIPLSTFPFRIVKYKNLHYLSRMQDILKLTLKITFPNRQKLK